MLKYNKAALRPILEDWFSDNVSKRSLHFDVFIMFLIFVSSVLFVVETSIKDPFQLQIFYIVDGAIFFIFSLELAFRIILSKDRKAFFSSTYSWIDILAVIPFWIGLGTSYQYLRMFRLLRVFRFFRFLRFSRKYLTGSALDDWSLEKLFVFRVLFTIFMFMFVAAALVFQIEGPVNPGIDTFFDAFYFVMVSATTVGYGDIIPVTKIGRIIIMLTVISALIIVPVHISSLVRFLADEKNKKHVKCSSCGHSIHERDARYCIHCGSKL